MISVLSPLSFLIPISSVLMPISNYSLPIFASTTPASDNYCLIQSELSSWNNIGLLTIAVNTGCHMLSPHTQRDPISRSGRRRKNRAVQRDRAPLEAIIPHALFQFESMHRLGLLSKFAVSVETPGAGPELNPAMDGEVEPFHFHALVEFPFSDGTARLSPDAIHFLTSWFSDFGKCKYIPGGTSPKDRAKISNYLALSDAAADELVSMAFGNGATRLFWSSNHASRLDDLGLQLVYAHPIITRSAHQHGMKRVGPAPSHRKC